MESRISPSNALKVDADRLWATIDRSAKIGRFRGTELRRLALSPEDKRATSSSAWHGKPAAMLKWTQSAISLRAGRGARTLPGAHLLLNAALKRANRWHSRPWIAFSAEQSHRSFPDGRQSEASKALGG
jgi:hypothetical protein